MSARAVKAADVTSARKQRLAGSAARSGQARKRLGRLQSAGVIRDAATALFLKNGYLGTSMDEIAAAAGVSKQTVYTHFADKERLFTELVLGNTEVVEEFGQTITHLLVETDDLANSLRELARRYLNSVIKPQVLLLRRLVIGEAERFPELARIYYERVPERVLAALASSFEGLGARGLLRFDDPLLAAGHFVALVLWIPLDRAMFIPDSGNLDVPESERLADLGVRVFLAAYGRDGA